MSEIAGVARSEIKLALSEIALRCSAVGRREARGFGERGAGEKIAFIAHFPLEYLAGGCRIRALC